MNKIFEYDLLNSINWQDLKKIFEKIPKIIKKENIEEILDVLKKPEVNQTWDKNKAGIYHKNQHFINIEYKFENVVSAKIAFYLLKQVLSEKNKNEKKLPLNIKYDNKTKTIHLYHLTGNVLKEGAKRKNIEEQEKYKFLEIQKEVNLLMSTTLINSGIITLHNNLYLNQDNKKEQTDFNQALSHIHNSSSAKKIVIHFFSGFGKSLYGKKIYESLKELNSESNFNFLTHASSSLMKKSMTLFRKSHPNFNELIKYLDETSNSVSLNIFNQKRNKKSIKNS